MYSQKHATADERSSTVERLERDKIDWLLYYQLMKEKFGRYATFHWQLMKEKVGKIWNSFIFIFQADDQFIYITFHLEMIHTNQDAKNLPQEGYIRVYDSPAKPSSCHSVSDEKEIEIERLLSTVTRLRTWLTKLEQQYAQCNPIYIRYPYLEIERLFPIHPLPKAWLTKVCIYITSSQQSWA